MRPLLRCLVAVLLAIGGVPCAPAQTTANPDISVIPRFLVTSDDAPGSDGTRRWHRPDFSFEELEIVAQGYLNPYARADVVLTLPGPDLEEAKLGLEEVYVSVVRGLPLDLNLRLGKYRAEFGKINMAHPHAWPFVTPPLVQERFFGDGGLNDLGISASVLLPTGDVYTRLTADLLRGNAIGGVAGIADTTDAAPFYAVSSRLAGFFTLSDVSDLEIGLSGLTGIHDPYRRARFWYANVDFKFKYAPDDLSSLVVQGEYLVNRRKADRGPDLTGFVDAAGLPERRSIVSSGMYLYTDYLISRRYSLGARFDWSQLPYSSDDRATAYSLFFGYYPVEETLGLRLEYRHTKEAALAVSSVALQVLFSLGPHRAHVF